MSGLAPSTVADRELSVLAAMKSRLVDYVQISKPRISVMVLITVAIGFSLAPLTATESWNWAVFVAALGGVGLAAIGSGAVNQAIERRSDALMNRTANRPVPAGRIPAAEAAAFGLGCAVVGVAWLFFAVNSVTAVLCAVTFLLYTLAYTPLKRWTSLSTAIGAIPGAMPPVLGWTAAGGSLDSAVLALFAIQFVWQFPHFMAIAWLYRDEYSRAGLRMLPRMADRPGVLGSIMVSYAAAFVVVCAWPARVGVGGDTAAWFAVVLAIGYLAATILFAVDPSRTTARRLVWVSLAVLPAVWLVVLWDHRRLLS